VRSFFLHTDWACDAASENAFFRTGFFRGMLWALFLVIPFLGRLKLFYENEAVRKVTGWLPSAYLENGCVFGGQSPEWKSHVWEYPYLCYRHECHAIYGWAAEV